MYQLQAGNRLQPQINSKSNVELKTYKHKELIEILSLHFAIDEYLRDDNSSLTKLGEDGTLHRECEVLE